MATLARAYFHPNSWWEILDPYPFYLGWSVSRILFADTWGMEGYICLLFAAAALGSWLGRCTRYMRSWPNAILVPGYAAATTGTTLGIATAGLGIHMAVAWFGDLDPWPLAAVSVAALSASLIVSLLLPYTAIFLNVCMLLAFIPTLILNEDAACFACWAPAGAWAAAAVAAIGALLFALSFRHLEHKQSKRYKRMSEASFSEMEPRLPQQLEEKNSPGFWKTTILCVAVAAAAQALGLLTGVITGLVQDDAGAGMFDVLVVHTGAVLLILLIASRLSGSILPMPRITAKRMLLWIAVLIASTAATNVLLEWLLAPRPPMPQIWEDAFAASPLLLFCVIVLAAPISEEILFRGLMFAGWSRSKLGATGTILLTTALWMAIHIPQYNDAYLLIQLSIVGLLLGFARYRTGSILVPIVLHVVNNLTAYLYMVYTLPASG